MACCLDGRRVDISRMTPCGNTEVGVAATRDEDAVARTHYIAVGRPQTTLVGSAVSCVSLGCMEVRAVH